jgi:hypothetical protein
MLTHQISGFTNFPVIRMPRLVASIIAKRTDGDLSSAPM